VVEKANSLLGKINVYDEKDGEQHVEVYIALNNQVESLYCGIAVDGSLSMKQAFAAHLPALFQGDNNIMKPIVRQMSKYAAGFTGDGNVNIFYWAVGPGGTEVESIGNCSKEECDSLDVAGPKAKSWGTGTKLLPAIDEFMNNVPEKSKMAMLLVITDGLMEDLSAVKERAMEIGKELVDKPEKQKKFVVVGVAQNISGGEVDEMRQQLEDLDDMFEGTELGDKHNVDLWDTKLASEMTDLAEIWGEVDFEIQIPGAAKITDDKGNVLKSYTDGFPQKLDFNVRAGAPFVILELAGTKITQPLV
jgi:hypothetical protein